MTMVPTLIIVGGGIGGAAAALRAAQNNIQTLWILGDRKSAKSSRGKWVKNIDNMIGVHPDIILKKIKAAFADDALVLKKINNLHLDIGTQDLVNNVKERIQDNPLVTQLEASVKRIYKSGSDFVVEFNDESLPAVKAPFAVVSTGLMDRQPTIYRLIDDKPAPKTAWIYPYANAETVLYCVRCEGHLTLGEPTAVIGSSDTAAQIAILLFERYGQAPFLLLNGETPSFKPTTLDLLKRYSILIYPQKIKDLISAVGKKGILNGVVFEDNSELRIKFAFVALGLFKVHHEFLRGLNIKFEEDDSKPEEQKRVLIDEKGETHEPHLFCVGDMSVRPDEPVMMQIYTAQEYAVRAVDTIDRRRRLASRAS